MYITCEHVRSLNSRIYRGVGGRQMASTLKLVGLTLMVTSALAIALGTGAFAAIDADRIGYVGISDDRDALLGVDIDEQTVQSDQEFTLLSVTNRFGEDVDEIEVTIVDDGGFDSVTVTEAPTQLRSGESGDIGAQVACGPQRSGTVTVEITAVGAAGSVELTREVEISCAAICTIGSDDRIGDREFVAADELFTCTVEITAQNYEVDLETTEITQAFRLEIGNLHGFDLEESHVGGDTSLEVNNVNQDVTLEDSSFDGGFDLDAGNVNGDVEIEGSDFGDAATIGASGDLNGDIEIEESAFGDDLTIELPGNPSGDVEIGETEIDGDLTIVVGGNLNGDIEIEGTEVGGDLTIVVEGQTNGEIELEDSSVGGSVLVDLEWLNGDVEIEGNTIGGDLTVDIGEMTGGADVELGDNSVGGQTNENY